MSSSALVALIAGAAAALPVGAAEVTPSGAMLRFPDVSATHICFVYANDVWIVPRAGGSAVPLSSPAGAEQFPKFSPDGKSIAFNANYDGGREIYTMPISGGVPARVTHHPTAENIADWTPDGKKILFLASGMAGLGRQSQLLTVNATPGSEGGLPEKLPVPYAGYGSISPDGNWLAYTLHSTDTRTWKRYRGGMATDVWLFNLKDKTSKKITEWEGTDTLPMWSPDGKKVYFLSDNGPEHRLNVWSFDVGSGQRAQVTTFADDDVRWPGMGPGVNGGGEIVFQLGARLMLLDLTNGRSTEVKVTIPGDRPTVRPRVVNAAGNIGGASISPTGKRVAIEARGDLWSAPAKEGVVRAWTRTDGIAERDPSWSPDGKWIAYFSDESGEYDLWVRPSDAKPPEPPQAKEDEKKTEKKDGEKKAEAGAEAKAEAGAESKTDDAKADEKKADEKAAEEKKAADHAKVKPRKVAALGAGYRYNPTWSPDSKWITFTDKANGLFLVNAETGEIKTIDVDPWGNFGQYSWSHCSTWVAYARSEDTNPNTSIWVYNVRTGEKQRLTSNMFPCSSPAFDRKGEYLYYSSTRNVAGPRYSDIDGTYIYDNSEQLLMAPLRKDVKSPWLPESDEETLKKDEPKKDEKKADEKKADEKKADEKKDGDKKEDGKSEAKADGVSGTWDCRATGNAEGVPPEGLPVQLTIKVNEDGTVRGTLVSPMGGGDLSGTYDKATGAFTLSIAMGDMSISLSGTIKDGVLTGEWSAGPQKGALNGTKRGGKGEDADDKKDEKKDDKADAKKDEKQTKIDVEGFESRAMILPITGGSFGRLAVTHDNKLIYARFSTRGGGGGGGSIQIFDPKDDAKEEKLVTAGAGQFDVSADGKKLLVNKGGWQVIDASAGGGKATSVPSAGMTKLLNPREEWKQIFTEAWRLNRDFFYESNMHNVDWPRMREHYGAMLDDAVSREDVNWIISELISELNIGHAYLGAPGDVESSRPGVAGTAGLLGADYELVTTAEGTAYKISRIYTGGPWDADARGPLSQPGVKVNEGDYLLAVNGAVVDTSKDPWAAFLGTADRITSITVGPKPTMEGSREVLITPISSEGTLRYRAWIENNRAMVEKASNGEIGYVYVPNTGQDGQSDLYRQFFGQRHKAALIIDERWNGGGQIPTRFIELLNRPVVNYWARRDGKDWIWPNDGHNGPKAMLVNGLAGSGGDAFPWYFKKMGLGKVIGTRTWGGLVGISGNPGFVDGGGITVPTFGFYEKDGTWGVEGHGVDPDMVVIDDPALMQNGRDPQIDAAVSHLVEELKTKRFVPPARPTGPNRRGMGIPEAER